MGADVNTSSQDGTTALIKATSKGEDRNGVVRQLIEAGADVNATTNSGITPLTMAAYYGHEKSTILLL